MKYKAIFSDIDGTLLNSQHKISPKTETTIKKVLAQGVPFTLVSARPPLAMTDFSNQLNTQSPIVSYGGSLILDKDLNPIYSVTIPKNDLPNLKKELNNHTNLSINYYSGKQWFSNNLENKWTQLEANITQLNPVSTDEMNTDEVHKILIIGEPEFVHPLEQQLKQLFPHLCIYLSKNEYLEVMNNDASKSKAIAFLLQKMNLTKNEIISFGDNFNDLDMIEYAGLGVAMGNSPEEIKQKADSVTENNDDDGLAKVLEDTFDI